MLTGSAAGNLDMNFNNEYDLALSVFVESI